MTSSTKLAQTGEVKLRVTKSTPLGEKLTKKLRGVVRGAVLSTGLVFSKYKSPFVETSQIQTWGTDHTGPKDRESVKKVSVEQEGKIESLTLNKKCVSTSFEQTETSERIRMDFTDGTSLEIELEKYSIQAAYVARASANTFRQIDVKHAKSILENSWIKSVHMEPPKGGNPEVEKKGPQNQRLVFERQDGTQLVLELSPNAVRGITFFENKAQ